MRLIAPPIREVSAAPLFALGMLLRAAGIALHAVAYWIASDEGEFDVWPPRASHDPL